MLDIKFIRENTDIIALGARKKQSKFDVHALIGVDDERRLLLAQVEEVRAQQNIATKEIAGTTDEEARNKKIAEMQILKTDLQEKETKLKEVMKKWHALMLAVPNIPDMSVPEGVSDEDNQEIRTHGEKPHFSFTPKGHIELMENLGMLDIEGGTKISGFRGYVLKGAGVALSFALWRFAIDRLMKRGFELMMMPSLVNREGLLGTGYVPQSEEDLYKTQDGQYLAGTSEVGTMAYYMDTTFSANDLPKKVVAFSPCFRREAGSHGKDTKGLIRVHEFYKVEQVLICEPTHEASVALHEELQANAELLLQELGLAYRVVINCGGDLGLPAVKKYDTETWMPTEEKYRETHSVSYFHDFQTRRLNIKCDTGGKKVFAHSLNGTAVATPRLIAALVENNQNEDGSITVPESLRPFLGTERIVR